jgi:hypothetical protein
MIYIVFLLGGIICSTREVHGSRALMQKEYAKGFGAKSRRSAATCGPECQTTAGITNLDMWAIRDLIIVGYKGPMVARTSSASLEMVHNAAKDLALLMPEIHPVPACRSAASMVTTQQPPAEYVKAMAQVTWSCLGLGVSNFTKPFVDETQANKDVDWSAPNFVVGACQGSGWPRACSYWTSIHAMASRADAIGKGSELFQAVVHIFSGGALFCGGCTMKFRHFNSAFLTPDVIKEGLIHE